MAKHVTDTGNRKIKIVGGDGDQQAKGVVEPVVGTETKPCFMCRSWEHDSEKMAEHLLAMGLEANPDGSFTTPIVKDVPGRISLKLHPKEVGLCRRDGIVTQDLATCENWEAVRFASELASRINR